MLKVKPVPAGVALPSLYHLIAAPAAICVKSVTSTAPLYTFAERIVTTEVFLKNKPAEEVTSKVMESFPANPSFAFAQAKDAPKVRPP